MNIGDLLGKVLNDPDMKVKIIEIKQRIDSLGEDDKGMSIPRQLERLQKDAITREMALDKPPFKTGDWVMALPNTDYKFPSKFRPGMVIEAFTVNPFVPMNGMSDAYKHEDLMVAIAAPDDEINYFRMDSRKLTKWVQSDSSEEYTDSMDKIRDEISKMVDDIADKGGKS